MQGIKISCKKVALFLSLNDFDLRTSCQTNLTYVLEENETDDKIKKQKTMQTRPFI